MMFSIPQHIRFLSIAKSGVRYAFNMELSGLFLVPEDEVTLVGFFPCLLTLRQEGILRGLFRRIVSPSLAGCWWLNVEV